MNRVYFVSNSKDKFDEIKSIVSGSGGDWEVCWKKASLMELQEESEDKLIRKKALEAFKMLGRPVLVEHTTLTISAFNQLPGLHTNYFYTKLGFEKIVQYCDFEKNFEASVESIFCLCDGKNYYIGKGTETGEIVRSVEGLDQEGNFGWDIIFIPEEDNPNRNTYACLEDKQNNHTMRRQAWKNLIDLYKNKKDTLPSSQIGTEDQLHELAEKIADKKVILFLGAGISASVDFPSWKKLIEQLGEDLGYEADLFESYGNYMMLAEYAELQRNKEVCQMLQDTFKLSEEVKEKLYSSRIYEILKDLDFPIIYTTNFDTLFEEYYKQKGKEIVVVKSIDDMQTVKTDIPRIMKFHGDIADTDKSLDSIVLTESQYCERMDFSNFMDIQLQADLLQYSVFFLGYSLSDINVKLLMYLARKRCGEHNHAMESYIYTATPNYVQEEVFLKNHIITFTGKEEDKKQGTQSFLEDLLKQRDVILASRVKNVACLESLTSEGKDIGA